MIRDLGEQMQGTPFFYLSYSLVATSLVAWLALD